jgi:uncharacterized protein (TIGR00730 family)
MRSPRVTVFGSSRARPEEDTYQQARRLGRLLVEAGYAVCSGGYGGVMEAVSRGAAEAGGRVLGITMGLWSSRQRANEWVTEEICAPRLFERLSHLVDSDAYVAMPGGPGTLGEVAITWNLFQTGSIPVVPLVLVGEPWRRVIECLRGGIRVEPRDLTLLQFAETVDAVVALLREFPRAATADEPRGEG